MRREREQNLFYFKKLSFKVKIVFKMVDNLKFSNDKDRMLQYPKLNKTKKPENTKVNRLTEK